MSKIFGITLTPPTIELLRQEMDLVAADGADGVVVELEGLAREEDYSAASLKRLFADYGKEIYAAVYRKEAVTRMGWSDDWIADALVRAAEAGADICDVMGDLFDPSPRELTTKPAAVAKQRAVIARIHAAGAQVIMSSHLPAEHLKPEEILAHLRAQQERGADILKIVTRCEGEAEFVENVRAYPLLKAELARPVVFVAVGSYSRPFRMITNYLGGHIGFATHTFRGFAPLITELVAAWR